MFKDKKKIIFLLLIIVILAIGYYYFFDNKENSENDDEFKEFYSEEKIESDVKEVNKNIIVHIMGEVLNEGIVEIPVGSRVSDAIDSAGGLKETADISNVNLAFVLEDGMKIVIPSVLENSIDDKNTNIFTGGGENVISSSNGKEERALININTATKEEFETLPGIGSTIAIRIIKYREENGKFSSVEDIKKVNGIGDSKFNNIKDLICVK